MFTTDEIKARIRREPFVPLRIKTSLGETVDVKNPRLVLFLRQRIVVGQPSRQDPEIYESLEEVWVPHVTAVEDLPMRRARNGNNRRKNRGN